MAKATSPSLAKSLVEKLFASQSVRFPNRVPGTKSA
jgi:hypothetical protein